MKEVGAYLGEFLNSPHPHRSGKVCPFMQKVLDENQLLHLEVSGKDKSVVKTVKDFFDDFLTASNKTVLVVTFSHDYSLSFAKKVARKLRLRTSFEGYMIGAFGPDEMTPSLHDQNFFPFRPDCVMLVIRTMVPHDSQFFNQAGFIAGTAMKVGYSKKYPNESNGSYLSRFIKWLT